MQASDHVTFILVVLNIISLTTMVTKLAAYICLEDHWLSSQTKLKLPIIIIIIVYYEEQDLYPIDIIVFEVVFATNVLTKDLAWNVDVLTIFLRYSCINLSHSVGVLLSSLFLQ